MSDTNGSGEARSSPSPEGGREECFPTNENQNRNGFPIVGIGSSAGGLEALQELFSHMPADTGMAFVVVSHQHPGHESMLPDLLGRKTDMQVYQIENGVEVLPNHVYVLGAGVNAHLHNGMLHLREKDGRSSHDLPIDFFFRSLADDMHERAIAVVLSGTGSDGSLGIREIKARGGMVVAQEPRSARYGAMPAGAAATGVVDFVEEPRNIPGSILDYLKGPYLRIRDEEAEAERFDRKHLEAILRFLRSKVGHDFSSYKHSTIKRRIERRMSIHGIAEPREYLALLHEEPPEAQQLFSELLISVTGFFRDPEAFEILGGKFLPELIASRPDNHELRVWVPGCATGEEAYSVALTLLETKDNIHKPISVRVFGTDLDQGAINRARKGVYPASISVDVSEERLRKFFSPEGNDSYAVRKEIRDMLVFAPHNVLSDPPFMKLDLLVCRNLLIYLQPELQDRLIPTFHYALAPGGLLFLGSSESVGKHAELFDTSDTRWKIYRRKDGAGEVPYLPPRAARVEPRAHVDMPPPQPSAAAQPATNRRIEHLLLKRFVPVSVVVDHRGTIVYIHGRSGAYLEPEQQNPRNNILEMARQGLRLPLSAALHQAAAADREVVRPGLLVKTNGEHERVDLTVAPVTQPESLRGLLLITIVPAPAGRARGKGKGAPKERAPSGGNEEVAPPQRIEELERELLAVKESNQTMVEELQSSNEELQSSNEELQSTNEELQSSKEEMESLNEELTTVNNELDNKVKALRQARDDMRNLLNSTDLGVIFLDQQLRVKRFTERARGLVSLRDCDVGRPISEITSQLVYDDLYGDCRHVLDTLERREREMSTREGTWQLVRILPYRTSENVIGGVVITFIDITNFKQAVQHVESMEYFQDIVETMRDPVLMLDPELRVQSANASFLDMFNASKEETEGKLIFHLGNGQWDIPALRELLQKVPAENSPLTGFEVEPDFPRIGHKKLLLNARRLKRAGNTPELILLVMREEG